MAWREQLSVGELTTTNASKCTFNIGTKEGGTAAIKNAIAVTERGTGDIHRTEFVFNDTPLTLLDTGEGLGIKIYTFPQGRIMQLGGTASLAMTVTSTLSSTLNSGSTVEIGLGSVTRTGDLTTTEQDFINEVEHTSSTTINVAGAAVTSSGNAVLAGLDGTGTAIAAFLNFSVKTNTDIDADATITLAGNINIQWLFLGDV